MRWINNKPLEIAVRTYALALSLSLGPSLLPALISRLILKTSKRKTSSQALKRLLCVNLGLNGFPFALALSVGGGAAMRELWSFLDSQRGQRADKPSTSSYSRLSSAQKTFISNTLSSSVGIAFLQSNTIRRNYGSFASGATASPSATIDFTLLLLVRAADAIIQNILRCHVIVRQKQDLFHQNGITGGSPKLPAEESAEDPTKIIRKLTSKVDALVFWACSARIMWCFFYEPQRLPRSYVKWIATLANLDTRVVQGLQHIRSGHWSYTTGSPSCRGALTGFAKDLGYNPSWADPVQLPAYGGTSANKAWESLGVNNRAGIGGLPCELVHGSVGSSFGLEASCTANASIRGLMAFLDALAIYLPVSYLFHARLVDQRNEHRPRHIFSLAFGALRSAAFLSSFIALYWYSVCLTRTLVLARVFSFISHDFWDGPLGGIFAGCLTCGSSIWIENGRRRGEMALYVLPRAIRTCLPSAWVGKTSSAQLMERVMFVLSFSTLITASVHQPDTLRGLSCWTLSFIMTGPVKFLKEKRKRQQTDKPH